MIKKLLLALAITALPVRSNAQKHFTIALSQRNIDILQKEVMDMSNYSHPNYGKYWSIDRINTLIAPPILESEFVVNYFKNNDINCINHRDSLSCKGNTYSVQKIFRIGEQSPNYVIPHELKPYVTLIDGISNKALPNAKKKS